MTSGMRGTMKILSKIREAFEKKVGEEPVIETSTAKFVTTLLYKVFCKVDLSVRTTHEYGYFNSISIGIRTGDEIWTIT